MRFCDRHWDDLRQEIKDQGIYDLVADQEKEVKRRLAAYEKDQVDKDTFDPLLSASIAIRARALDEGGPYLLHGGFCPICEVGKHMDVIMAMDWLKGAAEAAREMAVRFGLVSSEIDVEEIMKAAFPDRRTIQ